MLQGWVGGPSADVKFHVVSLSSYDRDHFLGCLFLSLQVINAVVLLVLLSALADPDQYHFSSSELGGDFEFMDDASKYIR